MIEKLLQPEVQQFIRDHEQDDEKKLILKHQEVLGVPIAIIADQLIGRRKSKTKLPLYYNSQNIVYPPGLNLEQCSSEKTAEFKAEVLKSEIAKKNTIADLTGGFGIDAFFISKVFARLVYVEPNNSLLQFAMHNHKVLGASTIQHQKTTAEQFIQTNKEKLDCIFIDPSRRDKSSQKVFKLSDCEPNVPELLPELFKKTGCILIKTSPLLDIQQGIRELSHVQKVCVVSVDNECKELLFLCKPGFAGETMISAVNITHQQEIFEFVFTEEKKSDAKFSKPLSYLYEPNASILKAGAFKMIASAFSLFKIDVSTHLYTSSELVQNFPGRVFKIKHVVKPDPKALMEIFTDGKANVITRNYPLTPDQLKKKTKLKDGGDLYLLGFSGKKEKYLVAAERIR